MFLWTGLCLKPNSVWSGLKQSRITDVYDTEALHVERIIAVREEPNCTLCSTRDVSRLECGHPGNFLLDTVQVEGARVG